MPQNNGTATTGYNLGLITGFIRAVQQISDQYYFITHIKYLETKCAIRLRLT